MPTPKTTPKTSPQTPSKPKDPGFQKPTAPSKPTPKPATPAKPSQGQAPKGQAPTPKSGLPKNPNIRPLPNQPQPAKPSRETLPGKPGKPTQENLPYKPAPAKPSFPKNYTPYPGEKPGTAPKGSGGYGTTLTEGYFPKGTPRPDTNNPKYGYKPEVGMPSGNKITVPWSSVKGGAQSTLGPSGSNFTPTTPSGLPALHKATPVPNRAGARRGQPLK